MKNVSMFLLFLTVAVCSAARFPFEPRDPSAICADCRGLSPASVVGCYCSDLHNCEAAGCTNFGGCSFADCDNTPARRALKHRAAEDRVLQALSRREPSDCPDCEGFGPGCPCDAKKYCESQGCGTGDCHSCTKKRTVMADLLLKREPNDCPDCAGFGPGCGCDAYEICKSEGCHTGECTASNCGKRKREMADFLPKREPNDCPDCAGFGPGCGCDAYEICKSEGCHTGECTASNCGKRKREMAGYLPKREPNDCPDCAGFGPGCGCDAYEICKSEGCHTGECTASNCGKRKREMAGYLPKREPNDCPDCAGFGPGCGCDAYEICKSEGCHTGECTASNCGKRKRTMADFLKKREPNDCPDCSGFGPGCGCDAYEICKSEGCHTGECTASNCGKKKRTTSDLLKRGNEICDDCPGFGPGCPCGDALLCTEMCGSAGECNSGNCSPTA
ncbi:uncharacterized protein LOC144628318 [Oculina patagonica]